VLIIIAVLFSLGVGWAVFLTVNMLIVINTPLPPNEKDYTVIVLGCKVLKSGRPSDMLTQRLIGALNLLNENENYVCVVTGGQGHDEPRPEAHVMRDWLIEKGISPERIFIEDLSVNTHENLNLAYEVITENNLPEDVIIVSDGFHLWRAKMTANRLFNEVHTFASYTYKRMIIPYWIREWAALTRDILLY